MVQSNRRVRWEELGGDLLVSIFERLPVQDLIAGVPFCCATWRAAAADPACWRRLDLRRWDDISRRLPAAKFRRLLHFCVLRSGGAAEAILFPSFAGELDLLYVAERCPRLSYFSLRTDDDPTENLLHAVSKLKNLRGMAIGGAAICDPFLAALRRRAAAAPTELRLFADKMNERTAAAICDALPRLQSLTLRDCHVSLAAVILFLDRLERLDRLDISGFGAPKIPAHVREKAARRLSYFAWEPRVDLAQLYRCSGACGDIFRR
ncbi:RNI-like superfamily protein [Wolffia australiana]